MSELAQGQFDDFFRELHGLDPYPWQRRLAAQVIAGDWPGAIDLPTGSGKTACIDIAIFALACQAPVPVAKRNAPRRLFFCVNRRVIVDEAHTRAKRIAEMIWHAEGDKRPDKPTLRRVAEALRIVGGTSTDHQLPPIDVLELRGGIYRDNRWARSIIQPTVVCTTLDQLGSRLLFRGYGVSPNTAPIQAALIAYDSLVLLDEAHISEPFRQTLGHVNRYLDPDRWAEQAIGVKPVRVVPMTATPNEEMRALGVVEIEADDRENVALNRRLSAHKPAELRKATKIVDAAVKEALALAGEQPRAIGIIVNRIATARGIYEELRKRQSEPNDRKRKVSTDAAIELVIGSMRPIDRDVQAERLRPLVGPDRPAMTTTASFVIATQCLEVGADYDFDALVTECASLDALRQRFGRLNRAGRSDSQGTPISARAVIVVDGKSTKSETEIEKVEAAKEPSKRYLDPIYGNALARTWNWLEARAVDGIVDFGIDAFKKLLDADGSDGQPPKNLLAPSASLNAPVMLPAYIDFWCQTAPKPVPDPDISLFIHGPRSGEPDVQVCWRADLVDDGRMTQDDWCDVVALLPPTSAECISLPISRLRRWFAPQADAPSDDADVLGVTKEDEEDKSSADGRKPRSLHPGVLWRGAEKSKLIVSPNDLKPGDTLVLPSSDVDSSVLGHLPETVHGQSTDTDAAGEQAIAIISDVAETACGRARDKAVLRLHPATRALLPVGDEFDELVAAAARRNDPPKRAEWKVLLGSAAKAVEEANDELRHTLGSLSSHDVRIELYPDKRGVVLTSRHRFDRDMDWFVRSMDEGDDESSRTQRSTPVTLADHSEHVRAAAARSLEYLPLDGLTKSSTLAAYLHDWGKADDRFQAMLRRTDRTDAWLFAGSTAEVIAKSDGMPTTRSQRKEARERAGLPTDFRHEMLSIQLAERSGMLPEDSDQKALILHLIAAHHGYARPFAPVVIDNELPSVEFDSASLSHEQRSELVRPHRLDSGIAERFWELTRRYGWWGLAYLEATLRLADQQASAAEDADKYGSEEQANQSSEAGL